MEQVHGVDVSWMTKGSPRDKLGRTASAPPKTPSPSVAQAATTEATSPVSPTQPNGQSLPSPTNGSPAAKRGGSMSAQRRNSWFSNISAKFSSSSSSAPLAQAHLLHKDHSQQTSPTDETHPCQPPDQPTSPVAGAGLEPSPPKLHSSKNAVLQHAAKPEGNGPYTPAPPKSGPGLLGVLRRLSSSGVGSPGSKLSHGLVERRTLNVDHHRQRCPISELKDARLRRVSFCVDVEIAPMPKYVATEAECRVLERWAAKSKDADKGEAEALTKAGSGGEALGKAGSGDEAQPHESKDGETPPPVSTNGSAESGDGQESKCPTKKKEKKKKSEEERKSRKEKRRRLAEDNGTVPIEIYYDSSDSMEEKRSSSSVKSCTTTTTTATSTATTSSHPTTNPVRIYRRCCQLRETPILKKITEQLTDGAKTPGATGIVDKLDLTDYWLQLPDFVTLGDWLAVVPVRQVVLTNCGLTDEALRVVLAGLLAAKRPASSRRRKPRHEAEEQGGVVERVVLKNNKLGPDGWKHLSLFLYMCRSLKDLDISHICFPKQAPTTAAHCALPNGQQIPRSISDVFAAALASRPAGATLEMVNMGETEPSMDQLAVILQGVAKCGIRRLGLAHNYLDRRGVALVAQYLASGKCKGLDLGGNDLVAGGEQMEVLAAALGDESPLWALSLAGCSLDCGSLGKMLPQLTRLEELRFIDLSHNHALFESRPSAVGLLRSYLPKMKCLKRIHLQDVGLTASQAIAIIEVLPEVHSLAHIDLLGNTELVKLAKAQTAEAQEEACALYASLLATTRVSQSLICVDIEVPCQESGEIVKAMAKQVVAYCLRNMERISDASSTTTTMSTAAAAAAAAAAASGTKTPPYPDVLAHLVGHDVLDDSDVSEDLESAPDDDYVIGSTGVVKALTCCLENRSRSDEEPALVPAMMDAKAKDMSKHLLAGARKIRHRLQPALYKAQANPGDEQTLRRLVFLDETLQGIINRFEDEFPDTRVHPADAPKAQAPDTTTTNPQPSCTTTTTPPPPPPPPINSGDDSAVAVSDAEDDALLHPPSSAKPLSRSNSVLSKSQAEEEGRMLRAGHRFRSGILRPEHLHLLVLPPGPALAKHEAMLVGLAEDIGGLLLAKIREKGPARALLEDRDTVMRCMRESDPEHWDSFVESQQKARANINVEGSESAVLD